jgi:ribosomal protein L14E/L6E/L27E
MFHIEPTEHKLEISSGDDDSIVEKAWKDSGLAEKLEIHIPKKRIKEAPAEKKKKSK